MAELEHELSDADVVVTCTGADSQVLPADVVERAMAGGRAAVVRPRRRTAARRRSRVAELAGVTLLDLDALKPMVEDATASDDVREARRIVDIELAAYVAARRASGVAPTVIALRDKAAQMVAAELHRLERRLPQLDDIARDEIAATVRRVVDKVLHAPTVRVQELADTAGPESYPEALRRLFDLDPAAAAAIAARPADTPKKVRREPGSGRQCHHRAAPRHPQERARDGTGRRGSPTRCGRAGSRIELVGVTTEGDRSSAPLVESGGVGVFVTELRTRLLDGTRRRRRPLVEGSSDDTGGRSSRWRRSRLAPTPATHSSRATG